MERPERNGALSVTPRQRMAPFQRGGAFGGVVFGAQRGVDAVGADEDCAFGGGGVFEVGAEGGGGFGVVGEVVAWVDVGGAEAGAGGVEEEHLEFAAVDGELRPVVAGFAAAGFVPDGFAVAGVVGEFLGGDGEGEAGDAAAGDQDGHRLGSPVS